MATSVVEYVVAIVRALLTIFDTLLHYLRPLSTHRLKVRTKGVDKTLLHSTRGQHGRAFVDGSVLRDARCGLGVYYGDGSASNGAGGFDAGAPTPTSNLAELAALYWVLRHHPRGQHLSVFSDSAHALRVVQAAGGAGGAGDDDAAGGGVRKARRGRGQHDTATCPRLDAREDGLALAIWWLLRVRTAQTCFYKVPAHKGFRQNVSADALARHAAENGPSITAELPLASSWWRMITMVLHYLLGQSDLDGGLGGGAAGVGGDKRGAQQFDAASAAAAARVRALGRPQPTGECMDVTNVLAVDCEMVGVGHVIWGGESRLASVAVVNSYGQQVYFSYAMPAKPVSNYRTKYSGITRELLVGAPPASQVQAEVRALLDGKVVVGHGLENDFKVLGFFPPRYMRRDSAHDIKRLQSGAGRPRKLRHITWEFLGKIIQDGDDGHDPLEDARAALLLYQRFEKEFEQAAERHKVEHQARGEAAKRRAEEGLEQGGAKAKTQ